MEGFKFRRQEPIDNYIVDFVCFENRLIIEVDGGQHAAEKEKDIERDNYLMRNGFKVLRFWNNEVFTNIEGVLEVIRMNCLNHPPLTPPVKGGEKMGPPIKGGVTIESLVKGEGSTGKSEEALCERNKI